LKLRAIHGLFFASGATALVYQVAWQRNLSLVFGASFEAVSIVLAAFMGGLAAGGFYFGRRAARFGSPLRLYGLLEIGIGLFALVLPAALDLVNGAYLRLALRVEGTDWTLNAARVAMALAVLLLPTFCMGGTLPVLVRFAVRRHGELGGRLSRLYAVNTAGAVLGTLAAGFLLLPWLGVWHAEVLAAIANIAIGTLAIAGDRALATRESEPAEPGLDAALHPREELRREPSARDDGSLWPFRLAFFGTAVAGMAALALEVAWARAIAISSGANTYSFTVMLATFLFGIALGSRSHGRSARRRGDEATQLGVVLVLVGVSSFVVCRLISRLPEIALFLNLHLLGGAGIRAGTTFALSFLVMLVPCFLMGIAFPLAGEARARLDMRFAESVGDLVGLNTAGAILGSLLAGFVLIPQLGLQRTMLLASGLYLGYGLLVLCSVWGAARPGLRGVAWVGALASLPVAIGAALLVPGWDPRSLTAITNNDQSLFMTEEGRIDFQRGLERAELLYAREGRGSTASVIRSGGVRSLLINGKVVATDEIGDMQHEYLLGHLPTLLHPDPRSAAVIGLGAGLTLGGVASEESIEQIVVVEIEPAVRGAAQIFADLHDDALSDPRVELAWQDGRNYLLTTRRRFDVITADPIHPWAQGAAYLYTTEYYGMIAQRLRPGGIACQWLPLYELSEDDLKSVTAAFLENFPYATLWQATGDLLLIGSNAPIGVDLDRLDARLRRPRASRQLARAGLDETLSFLTEFAMDRAAMVEFSEGATVNSDDNLFLEFSSPLSIGIDARRHLPLLDSRRANAIAVVQTTGSRFGARGDVVGVLDGFRAAKSRTIQAAPLWQQRMASPTKEGMRELIEHYRRALELGPGYRHAAFLLAWVHATLGELELEAGGAQAALANFRRAHELDSGNARANLHLGVEASELGRFESALAHFEAAALRDPQSVDAHAAAGQALMALGRYEEALDRLRRAVAMRPDLAESRRLLCQALRELGEIEEALDACRAALALAPGTPRIALELSATLQRAGRHPAAARVLREALAATPNATGLRLRLAWILATSPDEQTRDGAGAVRLVAPAARRTGDPRILDVLAAALAESGDHRAALATARRAARLAEEREQPELARAIRERTVIYQAGRPVRDAAPDRP
jgi:spermidine synthase